MAFGLLTRLFPWEPNMSTLIWLALLPAQFEPIPSKEFSAAGQETALRATVRLVNPAVQTDGTGVVVGQAGPFVYILTARHVVTRADKVEVHTFVPASWPQPEKRYVGAEVVARSDEAQDLALVRIATRDRFPGTAHLVAADKAPRDRDFRCLSVGCTEGKAPRCRVETVAGKRIVRRPGVGASAPFWEASAAPTVGRSGGPLFGPGGRLIGICSGAGDSRGYYVHPEAICAFLKSNAFRWLYEER